MPDFTFERFEEHRERLSVFPPTVDSLRLAEQLGIEFGTAFVMGATEVEGLEFQETLAKRLGGFEGVAINALPIDTYAKLAGAAQNTRSYVQSRSRMTEDYGTEIVQNWDNLATQLGAKA